MRRIQELNKAGGRVSKNTGMSCEALIVSYSSNYDSISVMSRSCTVHSASYYKRANSLSFNKY